MDESLINDIIKVYRNYRDGESAIKKDEKKLGSDEAVWLYGLHQYTSSWHGYFDRIVSIMEEPEVFSKYEYPLEYLAVFQIIEGQHKEYDWKTEGISDIDLQNEVIKHYINGNESFLNGRRFACTLIVPAPNQMEEIRTFISKLTENNKNPEDYTIEPMKEKYLEGNEDVKERIAKDKYCVTASAPFINKAKIERINKDNSLKDEEKKYEIEFRNKLTKPSRFYIDVSGECILLWIDYSTLLINSDELSTDGYYKGKGLFLFVMELFGEKGLFFKTEEKDSDKWMVFNPVSVCFEPLQTILNQKIDLNLFFLRISHIQPEKQKEYYPYNASVYSKEYASFLFREPSDDSLQFFDLFFDSSEGMLSSLDYFSPSSLNAPLSAEDLFAPVLSDFLHNYFYPMTNLKQCQRVAKGNILSTYLKKERETKREIKKGLTKYKPFLKFLAAGTVNYETAKPSNPSFNTIFFQSINKNDECSSLFENFRELRIYVETEQEKTISRFASVITVLTLVSVFADISNFAYSYTAISSPNTYRIAFKIGLLVLVLLLGGLLLLMLKNSINKHK